MGDKKTAQDVAWVRQWKASAATYQQWHGGMRRARERYAYRHAEYQHRPRLYVNPQGDRRGSASQVEIAEVADVVAYVSACSDLTAEEWRALVQWHTTEEARNRQLTVMLDLLSFEQASEMELVAGSDLRMLSQENDEGELVEALLKFISRFTGAQRRRVIHVLLAMNESGVEIVVGNNKDGEPYAEMQSTMRAGKGLVSVAS